MALWRSSCVPFGPISWFRERNEELPAGFRRATSEMPYRWATVLNRSLPNLLIQPVPIVVVHQEATDLRSLPGREGYAGFGRQLVPLLIGGLKETERRGRG
jgi:hypothetical protein